MGQPFQLADVLGEYVNRSGYTTGQLAKLTGIPKPTIVNWIDGRVKRPRANKDLLRLAAVLHLNASETNHLLQAADHPPLTELRSNAKRQADTELLSLLEPWQEPRQTAVKRPPFQAMADLPYFVGREEPIAMLKAALTAESHKTIYSIQGMGGVGKTALAAHLAYQLRPYFPDGVLWARADASDAMSILGTFASAYGEDVNPYADLESRSRVIRELLAHKRALMVLDNVQSSEQVKPLLPPSGPCAVLITTRRHDLSITRAAHRCLLGPFSQRDKSLALLAQILGEERVAAERDKLVQLAEMLGHLPLALDVAASRLAYEPGWSTAEFLERIAQAQRRLAELSYDDQSVRLSFATSYEALTPEQQQFFATLSVFAGEDFSDEAAAYVADLDLSAAQDQLRRLYGLSLVQQGRQTPAGWLTRYQLHPLLRDYARRHLDSEAPYRRLIAYYVDYLQRHHRDFRRLEQELGNITAVLQMADEYNQPKAFIAIVTNFYRFLEARGLYEQADDYLQQALTYATGHDEQTALLTIHHQLGRLAQRQGEYIEAEIQYEAALELARALEDRENRSHLLRALGVLAARRGDYVLADAYYKEGMSLAREFGRGDAVSNFLRGLGVQAYLRGDFARAEAFYEEGLALMNGGGGETADSGGVRWGLGVLAQEQGDWEQADAYYREALEQARRVGHQERVIVLLRSLASLRLAQDNWEQAVAYLEKALEQARKIGHRWQIARTLAEWGEIQLDQGQVAAAKTAFAELFSLARMMHSQELVAVALYGQARVAAAQREYVKARRQGEESLDSFVAIGHYRVQEVKDWLANSLPD